MPPATITPSPVDAVQERLDADIASLEALAASDDFDPADQAVVDLQGRITRSQAQLETLTTALASREAMQTSTQVLQRAHDARDDRTRRTDASSLGEVVARSRQLAQYGGFGSSGRIDSGVLTRALPMTTSDLGDILTGQVTSVWQPEPILRTPLLNLVGGIPITGAWQFIGLEVGGGGANPVVPITEGADKPSVELVPFTKPASLDTLPVWTQVTRQALEDIPTLRSVIDSKLRRLVMAAAETRIAAAIAAATLPTADGAGSLQAGIRNGIATVQMSGYVPNVVIVNPMDAAAVDVAALANACCSDDNFWGLTVVPASSQAQGTAIVADVGALVERVESASGLSVYITDSHGDTFIQNVFTILCELRDDTMVVDASAGVAVTAGTAP